MEKLIEYNERLMGLPAGVIIFFACLAAGYGIKSSRRISNDWIPTVVMLTGTVLFMLVAPSKDPDIPYRIWLTKNAVFGFIIGFSSWMSHKLIIKRIENKLGLFDASYDTEFKRKGTDGK